MDAREIDELELLVKRHEHRALVSSAYAINDNFNTERQNEELTKASHHFTIVAGLRTTIFHKKIELENEVNNSYIPEPL